ncbi:MAG: gamma-glutamyltransferase [Acidobacteria bacterium]|nr:gamma-glutamyltransferase [Acidobacteriota bacterium]
MLILCLFLLQGLDYPISGTHGAVASSSTLASEVGIEILKKGGNAVDAAVAVGFALAVTHPTAGNLGGGGFAVVRLADGSVQTLDFRETAPEKAHRDMYLDEAGNVIPDLSTKGHLASGVPGSVDGLLKLLENKGSMSRELVLAPAIALAEDGFRLSVALAEDFKDVLNSMSAYPQSMAVFSKHGVPYEAGELFRQADLAATLKRIAKQGRADFYEGKTASLIVAEMERGRGLISATDLKKYASVWREPIVGSYRGHEVYSMPPPSSGGVLLVNMLNMVEPYDVASMGWGSSSVAHLMIEAERRAYADRAQYLGDPDFVDVPSARLTEKSYAAQRFANFDANKVIPSEKISYGTWPIESSETTHYSVIDAAGNAVAITTTLNWGYGNRIVVTGAGFLLNNEMDDFSVKPNTPNSYGLIGRAANEIKPGKRMLSSMTPTIVVKDGKPVLVTGSPGGSTIITTVFQVLLNTIDHKMNVSHAVAAPRFHHQWLPDRVIYETRALNADAVNALTGKGHVGVMLSPWKIGAANSVAFREGRLEAASDPRRDAVGLAY